MTTLTKLMSGAALALILAVPATAQDAAAPDASAEQAPGGDAVVGEPAEAGTQSGEAVEADETTSAEVENPAEAGSVDPSTDGGHDETASEDVTVADEEEETDGE